MCQPSDINPSASERLTKPLQLPIHPEMSYSFPDSFGDFTNGSTFEVDDVYYQGWPWPASGHGDEAHFYQTSANIEALQNRNQLEPQFNLLLHKVSTARFRDLSA